MQKGLRAILYLRNGSKVKEFSAIPLPFPGRRDLLVSISFSWSRCSRSAGALGCHTRIRAGFPRERWIVRTLARDRPSPYGEGAFFPVARGPVPRERWIARMLARETRSPARVACEGPSPTVKGDLLPPRLREVRRPIASRPGGLSYRETIDL